MGDVLTSLEQGLFGLKTIRNRFKLGGNKLFLKGNNDVSGDLTKCNKNLCKSMLNP